MNADVSCKIPGTQWLNAKLSRKMVSVFMILAVLGWMISFSYLLRYLQSYVGDVYDYSLDTAQDHAREVASFLSGSRGDYSGLTEYLEEQHLGCLIQDSNNNRLFEYMPQDPKLPSFTVSGTTEVTIPGQEQIQVHVWGAGLDRDDLQQVAGIRVFIGLTAFNLVLFAVAATMLYLLIVAPIIGLRQTMQDCYDSGALPPRSTRIDEIGRLQNSFSDLIQLLRAKEKSEHRLIASISHDIKTPLTAVLGYSERLLSNNLTPERQAQYLQCIHDKGMAIKSLVDEFDEYLDAGLKSGVPMERVSAEQLTSILREEYQSELADAGVALTIQCDCPSAEFICDLPHIRRFMGNLISNSIQHANVQHLKLNLLLRQERGHLVMEFSDNGVGVPPHLLQQIFEPLYTTDRGRKVSGLGLSICRSIIRAHGGTLTAENCPEGGLKLCAVLPLVGQPM